MYSAIKSEAIRIIRPSFLYGGLGLMAGFTAMISLFLFSSAGDDAAAAGPGPGSTSIEALEAAGGIVESVGTISTLIGIIALASWAIAAASDYDSGLIRSLVQAQPRRLRLLGGKVVALVGFTAVGALLSTIVATALAWPLASVFDVSTAAWTTGFAGEFLGALVNLTVAAIIWGAVGLAVAVLTRSSGIAIAVGIGYLMVVENLLAIVAADVTTYFPASVLSALASGGTAEVGYLTALALGVGYGLAAVIGAGVTMTRRQIVS